MAKLQMNGTVKTIGTVAITAVILGGLIWGVALDSGKLDRCTDDVVELKTAVAKTQTSTHEIEKSMVAMQKDIASILQIQRTILNIPEPPEG